MVNKETIHTIVGIVGNVVAFALFISPMPTFYKIYRDRSVQEYSPNPYLAGVMNCLLWVLYGLPFVHPKSIPVLTINSIGLCIELFYISVYICYATNARRVWIFKVLSVEVVFYIAVIGLTLGLAHTHEKRSLIVGILCVIFGIFMYAMPLDVMRLVITTRSVEYMPFFLSLCNLLNGCIWSVYGILRLDLFVLISNGVGTALGLGQLILYGCYYKAVPLVEGVQMPNRSTDV